MVEGLVQGSTEWLEWRRKGIGSSEVAAILGVCPWNTPYGVWSVITGRSKGFEGNSFTQHGQETEARARARYELRHLEDMNPICVVHPKYSICRVSLDGLSEDGKKVLEIKCPKSRKTLDEALAGKVPENYYLQVQYQLAVTGADECDFFVYHEESGEDALVNVKPDIEYQGKIIAAVLDFWEKYVVANVPPPLTEKDVKIIDDDADLFELCTQILQNKDTLSKEKLNELKAMAVSIAGHPKMKCGRVQISTVNRNGIFSYHKLTIAEPSNA